MKEAINCDSNSFDKNDLIITIKDTGPRIPISFHRVFCDYCQTNSLPKLLDRYKDNLGELSNLSNLRANRNILKTANQYCDVIGCLLPFDRYVVAGSNSLRFIKKPTDRVNSTHPFTAKSESSKAVKKKKKNFQNQLL